MCLNPIALLTDKWLLILYMVPFTTGIGRGWCWTSTDKEGYWAERLDKEGYSPV